MPRSSSTLQLIFSDQVLPCQEPKRVPAQGDACVDGWQMSLTLPNELITPGTYRLADHQVAFAESVASVAKDGCGGPACESTGSAGAVNSPDDTSMSERMYGQSFQKLTARNVPLENRAEVK